MRYLVVAVGPACKAESRVERELVDDEGEEEGIDVEETFSPVAMLIRILFSIAAHLDVEIWQMDVKTAFINGHLEEDDTSGLANIWFSRSLSGA